MLSLQCISMNEQKYLNKFRRLTTDPTTFTGTRRRELEATNAGVFLAYTLKHVRQIRVRLTLL